MRKLASVFALASVLIAAASVAGAVDLTGKWFIESVVPGGQIIQITQTGSSISIPYFALFTGTVGTTDPSGFTPYDTSFSSGGSFGQLFGRITPSGNLFDGLIGVVAPPNPPGLGGLVATRCTCDDDNTIDGDGCDATCQVEPCWTCAGDPSVCAPTGDGSACDDHSPCTTGETCSGGVCSGGTPVAPCFDMSGPWTRHRAIAALGVASDTMSFAIQRDTDLRLGSHIGSLEPATGMFDVRIPDPILFCGGFDYLFGSLAPDGLTYSATGSVLEPKPFAPDQCDQFALTEIGDHCGNGTFNGSEACDDGNLINGDGCSAQCVVEQCSTCTGTPSVCGPAGGGACDDGNPCTTTDTCAGDGSCVGTPVAGTPCDDGSACTTGDVCAGDGTCAGAPVDCGECYTCDIALGCMAQPGVPCDDDDACTPNSFCQLDGSCLGSSSVACEPCFACDPTLGCVAVPQAVCKSSTVPARSLLSVKNDGDDSKDRFNWRWKKGTDTLLSELGNPPGGDDVSVCVYDESTATTSLLFRATIPGSALWTPIATGFRYRDPTAAADGMFVGSLKSATGGNARGKLKGEGVHLSDRAYGLPALPLPLPLRVQLHGENGLCLETRHDASSVLLNDPAQGRFEARGIP